MDSFVLYLMAFLLLVYRMAEARSKKEIAYLFVFLAVGFVLAFYESADLILIVLGTLIFNGIGSTYHSKMNYAFFILAILFIQQNYAFTTLIAQAMLLGFLSCAYFFSKPAKRASISVERTRDVIQIVLGSVVICFFAIFSVTYAEMALMILILLFSTLGNFSVRNKKSTISRLLNSLERRDAMFGQGAMWLAIGALIGFSFLNGPQIVAIIAAVFIGDAVATIIGTTFKSPLFYNSKKSISGTVAYFISAAIISVPFIGYLGIVTALAASLVESLPKHIDDNFDTAIVLTVLIKLFGL